MKVKCIEEIENIIRKNLDKRGMEKIKLFGELEKASKELLKSSRVLILTGFVIRDTLKGETDGPIGAISLASALEQLGKEVILVTDIYTQEILYNCSLATKVKAPIEVVPYENAAAFCRNLLQRYNPSHIVAIERPGKAKDGRFYSMRGEDLSDLVPNTDVLFEESRELGIITAAVGDGGNEIGMGKVASLIPSLVNKGKQICAVVSTDYLITAGVSNWGGHALAAALSLLTNTMLLHDAEVEMLLLKNMIDAGAVDGCTKKSTLTVDGLSLEDNIQILERLRSIVEVAISK